MPSQNTTSQSNKIWPFVVLQSVKLPFFVEMQINYGRSQHKTQAPCGGYHRQIL